MAQRGQSRVSHQSVCREFCHRFPKGKHRHAEDLVEFLMYHPASSKKIKEWIQSEEVLERGTLPFNKSSSVGGKHSKCNIKSKAKRDLGNDWFKKSNLPKSLVYYNEAIEYAVFPTSTSSTQKLRKDRTNSEDDDSCLPIALANRSAVYNELGEEYFDKALQDAEYALKFGYPERLRAKLILRKAGIYAKQGKVREAHECLGIILESKDAKMEAKIREIQGQLEALNISDERESNGENNSNGGDLMHFKENKNFENACEDIVIKTSKTAGRHVVAMKDLMEDKVLFREQPFASVLLPEFYSSHCHHCHKQLHDDGGFEYFFPCQTCTEVRFCDLPCSQAAQETYHRYECRWLGLVHSVGIAHLAVRIVLVAGARSLLSCAKHHAALISLDNLSLFKKEQEIYPRVYSLVDHIDEMLEEDLFQYALTAALLTTFLSTKTLFLRKVPEPSRKIIGGTILRHICQLICNAHAITDVLQECGSAPVVDEYQKRIATAIFPSASLMNHSCDPNIIFYFENGKTLIVKAGRDIQDGEDIYNCYGPHYRRMARQERQEVLEQQYYFICDCLKCKDEVDVAKPAFVDQFRAFKCEECEEAVPLPPIPMTVESRALALSSINMACENCGERQDIKRNLRIWKELCEMQEKGEYVRCAGDTVGSLRIFKSCFDKADKILHQHNSQYGLICDSIARCYISIGRKDDAKPFLERSLSCINARFGPNSLEFQRESEKYFELYAEVYTI